MINYKHKSNTGFNVEDKICTNIFSEKFSCFMTYCLRFIFAIIIIGSISEMGYFIWKNRGPVNAVLIGFYALSGSGVYVAVKKKVNKKLLFSIMVLAGLILRLIWIFSINNTPVSDFDVIYQAAIDVNNKDYSSMMGTNYFARFPHLIILVLYFSKVISLFKDNALTALKLINVAASTLSIIMMYLILNEVFKDYKKVIIGTFITAVLPCSILYTAVYCGENIAILFYLVSIYIFIRVMNKKNKEELLIFSGVILLIGHLFRMVGQIMIISYVMFIIIYYRQTFLRKIKCITYIGISFVIPFVIISNLLVVQGVTDQKLWAGSEPHITSLLRGSNIESNGRWNEEDAHFVMENLNNEDYLEQAVRNKIIDRYTHTNIIKLSKFVLFKLSAQWCTGDYEGSYWAQSNLNDNDYKIDIFNNGNVSYQLMHTIILLLIFKGLFNRKMHLKSNIINLFYIIFCGYGITFLILESQPRYGFIISWVFVILAMVSLEDSVFESKSLIGTRWIKWKNKNVEFCRKA